jgi:DNA adenine methylase
MATKKNKLVQPVLKWAGGKRQLIKEIEKYIPKRFNTYYEPFLGGGAVLFHLQPKNAIVNDINSELINCYNVIKDNVDNLIIDLKKHENEKEYFYSIRELDRTDEYNHLTDIERASRLIYLNRTCFNGLFRVNSQGQFNVPFGNYKNPKIVDEIVLKSISKYLKENNIMLMNDTYQNSLQEAQKGDFIYLDPPYDPVSDSSSFTGYTLDGFNRGHQDQLKAMCDELHQRKCKFLLSNSATPYILDLYKEYKIEIVSAKRNINSIAEKRGDVEEVLVRNYG